MVFVLFLFVVNSTCLLVAPNAVAISDVCVLLLDESCFRFCSDTFGRDPPLNAPKFVAGARFDFDFGFDTT